MSDSNYWSLRQTNHYPPDCYWCGPDGPCDGSCEEPDEPDDADAETTAPEDDER